ncbi:transcription factor bHLH131-like [Arachis hypogaea]|uniref:transcription factor bHLH131-like n=1 Tax=Arachis hypogaea TaxID=3818 RepID=UPI000DEC201C|nr:transcription factor bHLH131-like [Arachis hypogaea]XP_025697716.1 transcription factor bHLH131-like [Arachis hypogaea]
MVPLTQRVRNHYYSGAQILRSSSITPYDYIFTKPRSKAADKKQAAVKHSQAEKRRRMRINTQYEALKNLFQNKTKTDKASLLATTIEIVKNLRKNSILQEASSSSKKEMNKVTNQKKMQEACSPRNDDVFPSWEDKWSLKHEEGLMKATLNCEDKPGLMSTIAKAMGSVEAKVVKAEMVNVGGRTRVVLWVKDSNDDRKGEEILKRTLSTLMQRPVPKKRRFTQ